MSGLKDMINQAVAATSRAFKANQVVGALINEFVEAMPTEVDAELSKESRRALEEINDALQEANRAYSDSHSAVERCLDAIDEIRGHEEYMKEKSNQKDIKALDDLMQQTFQVAIDKSGQRTTCNDTIYAALYQYETQFSNIQKHYGVEHELGLKKSKAPKTHDDEQNTGQPKSHKHRCTII